MELTLKKETYKYSKEIYRGRTIKEESVEMIVPNSKPDILRLLGTSATVFLRSKEALDGKISITGAAETAVLYLPEDGGAVQKLTVEIPFSAEVPCPGAGSDTTLAVTLRLASAECKVLNPRKVLVRVSAEISLRCFEDAEETIPTGLEADGPVEVLPASAESVVCTSVSEKIFAVTDEFTLPGGREAIGEVMKTEVSLLVDDVKSVGKKLIFKGAAKLHLLYRTMESGELDSADFLSAFSQIMELEDSTEGANFELFVVPTGVYYNDDAIDRRSVSMELHAVAQCLARKTLTMPYIEDAYSTRYVLGTDYRDLELFTMEKTDLPPASVREELNTGVPVKNILDVSVSVGETSPAGSGEYRTPVRVVLLYTDEKGTPGNAEKTLEVRTAAEDGETLVGTLSGDVFASPGASGAEIRFTVAFSAEKKSTRTVRAVTDLSYSEEEAISLAEQPSLVVVRTAGTETLWELAKRYYSTRALIRQSNSLDEEASPQPGMLLIIPKLR